MSSRLRSPAVRHRCRQLAQRPKLPPPRRRWAWSRACERTSTVDHRSSSPPVRQRTRQVRWRRHGLSSTASRSPVSRPRLAAKRSAPPPPSCRLRARGAPGRTGTRRGSPARPDVSRIVLAWSGGTVPERFRTPRNTVETRECWSGRDAQRDLYRAFKLLPGHSRACRPPWLPPSSRSPARAAVRITEVAVRASHTSSGATRSVSDTFGGNRLGGGGRSIRRNPGHARSPVGPRPRRSGPDRRGFRTYRPTIGSRRRVYSRCHPGADEARRPSDR